MKQGERLALFDRNVDHDHAWLHAAADVVNPLRQPHLHLRPRALARLTERLPPPPPSLLQHWLEHEWRLPGEPALFYLARGLAHHPEITALAPTLWLRPPRSRLQTTYTEHGHAFGADADPHDHDNDNENDENSVDADGEFLSADSAVRWPGWPIKATWTRGSARPPASTLPPPSSALNSPARCGVFRVIGIHTAQKYPEFVQTGWEAGLRCAAGCPSTPWMNIGGPPSERPTDHPGLPNRRTGGGRGGGGGGGGDRIIREGGGGGVIIESNAIPSYCPNCGGPLRREPMWRPRVQVVLEPWGRQLSGSGGPHQEQQHPSGSSSSASATASAVAIGSEAVALLTLGRVVRLLYFYAPLPFSTNGPQQAYSQRCPPQQIVVHSAMECSAREVVLLQIHHHASSWPPTPLSSSAAAAVPRSLPEQYQQQQRELARNLTFSQACAIFQPNIVGQDKAKRALMLSTLYAIYTQRRVGMDRVNGIPLLPLHTLLVGPPKSGKSSLLRGAWRLFGAGRAEYVTPATVWRRGAGGGGGLDALWPCHSGRVLCGGAALLSECVILDGAVSSKSCSAAAQLQLLSLLESGLVESHGKPSGCGSAWGSSAAYWHSTVQVMMSGPDGPDTSALPPSLLPAIRLLIPLQHGLSLEQSASVGARVMSSVARSSASHQRSSGSRPSQSSTTLGDSPCRSLSQSSSLSASMPSSSSFSSTPPPPPPPHYHHHYRASPAATSPGGGSATVCTTNTDIPRQLSEGLLHLAVTECAPDIEVLEEALREAEVGIFFHQQLVRHAVLLEQVSRVGNDDDGSGNDAAMLPPPAFERGNARPTTVPLSAAVSLTPHLEALHAIALARLLLPDTVCPSLPAVPRAVVFTSEMAEEVWEVYSASLRTAARLMMMSRGAEPPPPPIPARAAAMRMAQSIGAEGMTNRPGHGDWPRGPGVGRHFPSDTGQKRPRGQSKKKMYLQFVQALSATQRRRRTSTEAGGPSAHYCSDEDEVDDAGCDRSEGGVCGVALANDMYERMGGFAVFQETFDDLMNKLQHAGMLIRRPHGWKVLMEGGYS